MTFEGIWHITEIDSGGVQNWVILVRRLENRLNRSFGRPPQCLSQSHLMRSLL